LLRAAELRATAREIGFPVDVIEKDYALGWILAGVVRSSAGSRLVFKGGSALSKIYFPGSWRLSEDLDFTLRRAPDLDEVASVLVSELPSLVREASGGLSLAVRDSPHLAGNEYLQVKVRFEGPIGAGTVKLEASREDPIGPVSVRSLAGAYRDYPALRVSVYTIENIVAEKLRAMAERRRVRDYYDLWKLARVSKVDWSAVRGLFPRKCAFKGIAVKTMNDLAPRGLERTLAPYLERGLMRLAKEPLPPLRTWLGELRDMLSREMRL
jgi:predicted nucleotidyltransferase component of viral defense system